jgi:SH3-like domain-containing protein
MARRTGRAAGIAVALGRAVAVAACAASAAALPAAAAEYRSVSDAATVLYDAPSAKARALFVLGRDLPLEVLVPLEGWVKVRDAAGTIGWVEKKALGDRRTLVVRVPVADVRASPDDAAPLVHGLDQPAATGTRSCYTAPARIASAWAAPVRSAVIAAS